MLYIMAEKHYCLVSIFTSHDFDDFVILFFYNSKLTVSGIEQVNKMYK